MHLSRENETKIVKITHSDSSGAVTRNLGFGFWRNGLKRQVEQSFSTFLDKFLKYLLIFQSSGADPPNYKNHQMRQKF